MTNNMTNKFKVGDKVRRVLNTGSFDYEMKTFLNIDDASKQIWTIERLNGNDDEVFIAKCPLRFFSSYFELVEPIVPMDEQIRKAKSFVGRDVIWDGRKTYSITRWGIKTSDDGNDSVPHQILDQAKVDGSCVWVGNDTIMFDLNKCELAPEYREFKLDDKYTAKIFHDRVEVGCQTFSHALIDDLASRCKKFRNNENLS